jgi:hypothetical protein
MVRTGWPGLALLLALPGAGQDPDAVRRYVFDGTSGAAEPVPNLAGDKAEPLVFALEAAPGAAKDEFRRVDGRRPGKKAVHLDQGFFHARAADVTPKGFTAVLWFRKHGPGAHRGNSGTTNGTLLAAGNGYWEGWRVTTGWPSRQIGFEIGRPQPSHSVGIQTGAVADGVWHHLAAAWDGRAMFLYVDGEPAASGPFAGPCTPPAGGRFRVGYADAGVGSAVLDVDEVVLYGRALPAEDIFLDANSSAERPEGLATRLAAVHATVAKKDFAGAEAALAAMLATPGLPPDLAAALLLKRGDLLRRQGKAAAAAAVYAALLDPGTPERPAAQALERLRELIVEGETASIPRAVGDRLLPALAPAERSALRLGRGHALAAAGDDNGARAEYAAAADATPAWRSLAHLCAGRALARAKDFAGAKAEYAKAKVAPGAPRHHIWEADERTREADRLQAGLPARDLLDGRFAPPRRPSPAVTLHVAPDGKDSNVGTKESPFATLERARDEIRGMKRRGPLPPGGAAVLVRDGEYRVRDTFKLGAEDSGTAEAPVVYRAAEGGAPRFNAGARIGSFQPVRDPAILARLPQESRGRVVQADLRAQGVTDLGTFEPGGFGSGRGFRTHPLLELFVDGVPMPISRWPNEGFVPVVDVLAPDGHRIHGLEGSKKGAFRYAGDRPRRWKEEKDPWLYGYWFWDWADSYEKVASIDAEKREIALAPPYHTYGYRKGQRWCAVNLLAEIDRPGEWHLDRGSGFLYMYPPGDLSKARVEVSVFDKPALELNGASHVAFEGLTWENGRGDAVIVQGGESALLAGCTMRQFGGNGIEVRGGARHVLLSCDVHTLGRGGAVITGGDRKTLAPGQHLVENCHLHHLSRIDHTYTPGVYVHGVAHRLAHNLIHDGASSGMRVEGNDHVVEFNEVHRVLLESDDQGGADMWGNPTYRGVVYRYNYWHDMGNGLGCGQAGIRLDDAISGVTIYGNVFRRCADGGFGGVQIHGGKENAVENNLFVECKAAVSFSPWGAARWKEFLDGHAKGYLQEVRPSEPPYAARYPELARLLEDCDANAIRRNMIFRCDRFLLRDPGRNELTDNWRVEENPGLEDPAGGRFGVKEGSPLWNRLSFQPIPFGEIGLYRDAYRKGPGSAR